MTSSPDTTVQVQDPWTALWNASVRGAWDLTAADPAAQALRRHWAGQTAWMADLDPILDVGSGPAVLARLLRDPLGPGSRPIPIERWLCLDQASLSESEVADLPGIHTMFGTRFEDASPAKQGVDALVSNFGLEYGGSVSWICKAGAWLRKGGVLHAVVHAEGSWIDGGAAAAQSDLQWAIHDLGFFAAVRQAVEAKATAPSEPMARMVHGVDIRDRFNDMVNHVKTRLEERGTRDGVLLDLLLAARQAIQAVPARPLDVVITELAHTERAYGYEGQRLRAMRSAAWSHETVRVVGEKLTSTGFEGVRYRELSSDSGLVAWVLDARKT